LGRDQRRLHAILLLSLLALAAAVAPGSAQSIPAGTYLNVRLQHPLHSYSAKRGQPVRAVLIAPVVRDGVVLLPAGAELRGQITEARAVGLGLLHERARLLMQFDSVLLPDGTTMRLAARLHAVLNAREEVGPDGRITGIRATAALGSQMSGWLVGAATSDVLLMLFSFAGSTAIVRFPESEIILPAGTELLLQTTMAVDATRTFPAPVRPVARTTDEQAELRDFVGKLPFRTATAAGKPSDITNVLVIGDAEAIARAFHAAAWSTTAELNAATAYRTFRSMAENSGYAEAPMSLLELDHRAPHETWQKGLNTFSARHHLRQFPSDARWQDRPAWPTSSTQDIGIGFSRKSRNFIHLIDPTIDNERNKIVNDLTFTGCVDAVELVPRPFIPKDAHNATNDPLLTDGDMAVVLLNDCAVPRPFFEQASDVPMGRAIGNPVQRGFRRFFLSMKQQLWRGNIVYRGVSYAVTGIKLAFGGKKKPEAPERTLIIDGVAYTIAEDSAAAVAKAHQASTAAPAGVMAKTFTPPDEPVDAPSEAKEEAQAQTASMADAMRRPPSTVELFMGPSLSRAETLGAFTLGFLGTDEVTGQPDLSLLITVPLKIKRGFGVAPMVTLHTSRFISHEIWYDYTRSELRFDFSKSRFALVNAAGEALIEEQNSVDPVTTKLVVRSLGYGFVAHARPREARVRPYGVIGPALTAYRLQDGSQHNSRMLGRLGLGNVGSVIGAIKAGRKAPLDGGTIYRWGLTYGGGVRAQLTRGWGLRADLRETLIETPDFASIDPEDLGAKAGGFFSQEHKRLRRRTLTIGATFSF
jgi:opacity protein-like surface antigen